MQDVYCNFAPQLITNNMLLKRLTFFGLAAFTLASCGQGDQSSASVHKMIDRANLDTTVRPGDNFYQYANGTWMKLNPIPKTETGWGSFNEVEEATYKTLHAILDSAASLGKVPDGSIIQKVGDFYRSGMDSVTINKEGISPLSDIMAHINNVGDVSSLIDEIGNEHQIGLGPVFSFGIAPDDKNVSKEICQFGQGGLGLPTREYYFDKDDRTVKIREAYRKYIPTVLMLIGEDQITAGRDAADIYNLELSLAGGSLTQNDMRDPYRVYNKFTVDDISKQTGMDWKKLLASLNVKGQDTLLVAEPKFFMTVANDLKSVPIDVWKKYLKFHLVNEMAPHLGAEFDSTQFNFYGKILYGLEAQRPRWKRILEMTDECEGEMLGQLYVNRKFKPEAKARMLELVDNLQKTYAERIQKLDWMGDSTKRKALTKLNAFVKKIGYPDKWKDYSDLVIVGNDFVKNIFAASQWAYNYNLGKLGKPVDKTEWGMTPPTINAYYNAAFNEIVFPAGILQYPFFDANADDAVNYGGIGAVIGHEMTHGFDDQGRLYNAQGNLSNWWSKEDEANFKARAKQVGSPFRKIIVIDDIHANDSLTEGENLADLGGINIAYEAFKKTKQGKSNDKKDGFTPDQRFFLSWAQVWRMNQRPEALAAQVKTDGHSPSVLRVNVPLSNMAAWYKAFDIKPSDKLFRPENERIRVW